MTEIDISSAYLIVDNALNALCHKFTLICPGDASKGDEFWFITLSNMKEYLREYENNSKDKVLYKRYIDWFISEWPPKINKKGNYRLSIYIPPPEVILSQLK
jgi:hypothetical protein